MKTEYVAYLVPASEDQCNEIPVGRFAKLSAALVNARIACCEHGKNTHDWFVDKMVDGVFVQRRSSMGGFEQL